jgi:uncharacterized protein (DUF488 family)
LFSFSGLIAMDARTIWTIGHSTHPINDFVEILQSFDITLLADIRSLPGSRKFPQFNKESLLITMPQNGIKYEHMERLGGRRKTRKDSVNTGWRLDSFRGYADYMETEDFRKALSELRAKASLERTAIMCAEALWWRCHRSLISDYLTNQGWTVIHITGKGKSAAHHYTEPARIIDGLLTYKAENE